MNTGPKTIHSLLEITKTKFFNKKQTQEEIEKEIQKTIKIKKIKIKFYIKNKTIYIKTNPAVKNEILLKKDQIIKNIKDKTKADIIDLK